MAEETWKGQMEHLSSGWCGLEFESAMTLIKTTLWPDFCTYNKVLAFFIHGSTVFIVILSVIVLSVIILSVIILSVIMLC